MPILFLSILVVLVEGAAPATQPARVDRVANESDFNKVTLTPKAEERLKIKTVEVVRLPLVNRRTYGGEVIIPLGTGSGENDDSSQSIFILYPSMTPADRIRVAESQVDADGAVHSARVQLEAAKVAMERAHRMLEEKSGSRRAVDEAQAGLSLAESELSKTIARRELLGPPVLTSTTPDRVWIRVPVYVGDLVRINRAQPALIASLASTGAHAGLEAQPVDAPPSGNPAASSVDLFYRLENRDQGFQLGERVGATLSLNSDSDTLVVPWASIIYDIYGGTWVYESLGEHQFARRRVQVSRVVGELAALASGPSIGTKVVTDGAAELFGTEVGFSK